MNQTIPVSINKRAVIYCRVSSKEQVDEGNSLSTQEKNCREYAITNGFDIARVFVEKGESAKTQNRTELKLLLSFCADRKNKIEAVIAYKIDRISRNTDDYSQIRILLNRYGVEIKSTSEYFENSPAGRFMENIIANVAQFDNDVRTERSINGMRDAVREGRYVWTAPIGYDNIRSAGKATIGQNEKMAPILRSTFELIAQNLYPLEEVRKKMMEQGLANRAGKPLSKSYFYWLLKNELYAGWIIKFGERHRGIFEPIISDELFSQVQLVLKNRGRKNLHYVHENPDFPLRRFVKYSTGKMLTGSWSQGRKSKYAYYRFGMKGTNYNRTDFENEFKKYIDGYVLDEEHYAKFKSQLNENLIDANKNKLKVAEQLKKQIEDLNEKQNVLIDKNTGGFISNQVLRQQLDRIDKELLNANAVLAKIPNKAGNLEELFERSEAFLKKPSHMWAKAKFNAKLKLQWFQFPQGITYNGKEFGTTEMCNLYKVNKSFSDPLSYRVPSKQLSWNNPEIINKANNLDNTIFWDKIASEIVELSQIMDEVESDPPD